MRGPCAQCGAHGVWTRLSAVKHERKKIVMDGSARSVTMHGPRKRLAPFRHAPSCPNAAAVRNGWICERRIKT